MIARKFECCDHKHRIRLKYFIVDTVDKETRSRYMSAVRSRGNRTTEEKMVRLLKEHNLKGWRRHLKIIGTPDFCWPEKKIALFVDGCFWHGCPRCCKPPKSNVAFWKDKVATNRKRDRRVNSTLRASGWMVIRVWECRIHDKNIIQRIHEMWLGKRGRGRKG